MYWQINIFLISCLLSASLAKADGFSFEFQKDPTQEDFEDVMRPYANGMRYVTAKPPHTFGEEAAIGVSYTSAGVSTQNFDKAKNYFDESPPKSTDVTRLTFESRKQLGGSKDGKISGGFLAGVGQVGGTKLTLIDIGMNIGTELFGFRGSYTTESGLDHLAICGYTGEALISLPYLPFGAIYGGYGVSSFGASAYSSSMSKEVTTSWTDRYPLIGFSNWPLNWVAKDNHILMISAEAQYASTPKQFIYSLRFTVER